ncbi:MAG TPA: enoyl-CoA hydratase/isomerase family protein [Thermoanaerobaculia bacterium]|nr:enoyl-CoA hydratase/isomerase family protein [Thermoanaerobaculia bacterium]
MIERSQTGGILTLRLAHGKASALDLEFMDAIALAFAEGAEADAVILTGTGSIFSAGVDLFRLLEQGAEYTNRFVPALSRLMLDLFSFPKPLVVAVNGHAIAGGCIMTLAADYRLMAGGNGRIGIPELLVGVPFPPSVIEAVRFAVPPQHLQSLMFTGRTVLADEALRLGLIDEVVDGRADVSSAQADGTSALLARAGEVARQLAALPARAFQLAKRQLREKTISRAKRYNAEFDDEVRALWSDPATHQRIRDYLAKTVKK